MPVLPKDPSIRRRRNKTATRSVLVGAERRRRCPHLPKITDVNPETGARIGEHEWHPLTRAWWHDVWASPMAAQFEDVDDHALFMLAVLVDAFWTHPSKELAAEIRLQRQAFGLTPIDRRRLQWEIKPEEGRTRQSHAVAEQAGAGEPADDPRSVLRMVK